MEPFEGADMDVSQEHATLKRARPSWDEYFMRIAHEVATRSTCPRLAVGAVIVRDKRILTTGYNEQVYTKAGIEWVNDTDMSTVLLRHYPALAPALRGVKNAFWPWTRV